ncbi:CDT1-like protein a, chloroplastic [Sesbania bispinosa]|nr:CDT1-like protein a, chloroplastic [Sesbania bispinosa]
MKIVSSADSLMTETPGQSAPRKLLPVSDVKLQDIPAQKSTSCFKPAKRVLDLSLMEANDDLDNRVDMLEYRRSPPEVDSIPEPIR